MVSIYFFITLIAFLLNVRDVVSVNGIVVEYYCIVHGSTVSSTQLFYTGSIGLQIPVGFENLNNGQPLILFFLDQGVNPSLGGYTFKHGSEWSRVAGMNVCFVQHEVVDTEPFAKTLYGTTPTDPGRRRYVSDIIVAAVFSLNKLPGGIRGLRVSGENVGALYASSFCQCASKFKQTFGFLKVPQLIVVDPYQFVLRSDARQQEHRHIGLGDADYVQIIYVIPRKSLSSDHRGHAIITFDPEIEPENLPRHPATLLFFATAVKRAVIVVWKEGEVAKKTVKIALNHKPLEDVILQPNQLLVGMHGAKGTFLNNIIEPVRYTIKISDHEFNNILATLDPFAQK